MKINNRLKMIIFISTIAIMLNSFVGCSPKINHNEGISLMQLAIENSLTYDVFYWKEIIRNDKTVEANYVNVHANVNNDGFILDENGGYTNYAIYINRKLDKKDIEETYCGLSKSSIADNTKLQNYLIKKNFGIKKNGLYGHVNSSKAQLSPYEFYKSDEFSKYTLKNKLFELSLLEYDDFDFSIKDGELKKNGVTLSITAKIKDSFCDDFLKTYGRESIFRCEKVSIETAYDRISKIVVYQKEKLDDKLSYLSETYSFELVYLGKNIWVPSYDDEKMYYV